MILTNAGSRTLNGALKKQHKLCLYDKMTINMNNCINDGLQFVTAGVSFCKVLPYNPYGE